MKEMIYTIRQGCGQQKIVFIHGNMASSRWWQPAMDMLVNDWDMLAVDLRGFGSSPDGQDVVTLADHATDIYEAVQQHKFSPFLLVGHSLGGGVAMQFAADYPEMLTGLVLVDSSPVGGMTGIDYKLLQMLIDNKELVISSLRGTMASNIDENYFTQLAADALRSLPAVIPNTRALENADFTHSGACFSKPVLVIYGEKDQLVPLAEAEKQVSAYSEAKLMVIPGVGHNPQVEDTQAFAQCINRLRKVL